MSSAARLPEVLTIDEAARYLRLSREVVEREVASGRLPGRRIYEEWRFLKAAIDDWLSLPDSRTAMLRQAGAFADDESLRELRDFIYDQRGRPETEDSSTT